MTPTLRRKLEALAERREELERLLADPGVIGDSDRFRAFSREFSQLEPVASAMAEEKRAQADLAAAQAMRDDPELAELADEEIAATQQRLAQLDDELMLLLLPKDNRDEGNLFLEVRAGTGGDEAAIFAGDLFRMYARYAERQGWKVEIESDSPGEHGGYKEVVARVVGRGAYSRQAPHPIGEVRVEEVEPVARISGGVGVDPYDENVIARHAEIGALQVRNAPEQEPGAREQDEGQCDLPDHQPFPDSGPFS